MPQQPMGPGDSISPRGAVNLINEFIAGYATGFTPFLRRDFGPEAFPRFTGVFAMILMLLMAASVPILRLYFVAWIIALLLARAKTSANTRRGLYQHSGYNGVPAVAMRLFRCKDEARAKKLEPLIVLLPGIALFRDYDQLGGFFIGGAVCMWMVESTINYAYQRKAQALRDARIEAEYLAELSRHL
ncbi:MAG TPA: hypothetical protein VHC22_16245 [Pirellulales bacterium]|nr:hypothetical protein [Pirellulales bacterium]